MCVEISIDGKTTSVKGKFPSGDHIIVQSYTRSFTAYPAWKDVYWDGWIKQEDVSDWIASGWVRAEVFADKFNQRGRWYDVPPDEIIKGIACIANETIFLKIVTRESVGKEKKVQDRFALTGKRILLPWS